MEPTTGKAKYYTLMEALKEQILSGTIKPGQKLPSENELTREYALSRHTVRKALALLENEGYITAQHGKGTFCSERVIQRHNSKNIAVTTTYLSDYIFPRLIQGMDRVLSENGYSIILKNTCNSRSKEEKVLKELLDKPIDGLIIEPSKIRQTAAQIVENRFIAIVLYPYLQCAFYILNKRIQGDAPRLIQIDRNAECRKLLLDAACI